MANNVLPLRTGELVRAYILGEREGVSKSSTLATILVERLLDGITMLLFLAVAALGFPTLDARFATNARLAGALLATATIALLILALVPAIRSALSMVLTRMLPTRVSTPLVNLLSMFIGGLSVLRSGRAVLMTLILSCLLWLCETGMYVLIGYGFGLDVPILTYVLATAAGNLAALIPAGPGNIGPFNLAAAAAMVVGGTSLEVAGGYVAVLHIALLLPITLLGFYYLWMSGISFSILGQLGSRDSRVRG